MSNPFAGTWHGRTWHRDAETITITGDGPTISLQYASGGGPIRGQVLSLTPPRLAVYDTPKSAGELRGAEIVWSNYAVWTRGAVVQDPPPPPPNPSPVAPSADNVEITGNPKGGAFKEWVQLHNIGTSPIELLGVKVRVPGAIKPVVAAGHNIYTFAVSTILLVGESVKIVGLSPSGQQLRSFDAKEGPLFYELGKDTVELLAADATTIKAVKIG